MKVFVIFAIVSIILFSVGLVHPVSSQTMCAGDKTLEDQYQEYNYIFSGKVSEIQPNQVRGKITLTVYEMWKGQSSDSITILSSVGESDYSIPFEIGNSYLVFASQLVFDEPVTSGCSPTKPLINASNEIEFLNKKTESKTINFQYPVPGSAIVAYLYSLKTQIEYGLSYEQLRCNEGHVLIQKYDGTPACVTESTKQKLIERGWSSSQITVPTDTSTVFCGKSFEQIQSETSFHILSPMALPEGYALKSTDDASIGTILLNYAKGNTCGTNPDTLTDGKIELVIAYDPDKIKKSDGMVFLDNYKEKYEQNNIEYSTNITDDGLYIIGTGMGIGKSVTIDEKGNTINESTFDDPSRVYVLDSNTGVAYKITAYLQIEQMMSIAKSLN